MTTSFVTSTTSPARSPGTTPIQIIDTVAEFSAALEWARSLGQRVGLVPTMGALHAGHRSLIARAAAECDVVAVTIFVNPLQFGDPEDIAQYPRTIDADVTLAAGAGATVIFAPPVTEMYPNFPATVATGVSVSAVSERWEGASRLGHFDGVSTVVAKLFAMAGRCRAYFGEKDFQQLAVVRRMAADLSFPVELIGCPTIRDEDGLALSSRNIRLSTEERSAALVLSRALRAGVQAVDEGDTDRAAVEACMALVVATEPMVELDYAVLVDADDLSQPSAVLPGRRYRLLIAAHVGPVRLIDNVDPVRDSWNATEHAAVLSHAAFLKGAM